VVKPVSQATVAVAGRGSFPLPPWSSAVAGRTFEVFPGRLPPTDRSRWTAALVGLTSPPERSKTAGNRLAPLPPLVGFVEVMPFRRHASRASTPGSRSSLRSNGCHPSDHVPSSWFLPTSTVSSARRSRVYCTPQPDKGSSRFAPTGARRSEPTRRRFVDGTLTVAIPATRFTPFEVFPSPTAAPHRCGRCLHTVTVPPKRVDDPTR
jgi:hypothetical protein